MPTLLVPPDPRRDLLAGLACAFVGLVLAVAPNLAVLARHGTILFLADADDAYYLSIARAPYYGEPSLRDPYLPPSRRVPTLHTSAMFTPWAVLDRALGLPLLGLSVVWRVVGGAALGASLYVLCRKVLGGTHRSTAWALGCSLVCLADAGFGDGRMLLAAVGLVQHLLAGTTPLTKPDALPQYRVVSPLLNIQALLLLIAVVSPPRAKGKGGVLIGSVLLAACIYLYFYFWTTAVVALGLYAGVNLALASFGAEAEKEARRDAGRFAALVLLGGLILGAPGIMGTASTGSDPALKPILERISKGYHLPEGSVLRTIGLWNRWVWVKLGIALVGMLVLNVRRLGMLLAVSLSACVLRNSALVTGLEFENFHWSFCLNAASEVLVLATVCQCLDRLVDRRRWLFGVAAAPAGLVVLALFWRPFEALKAPESVALSAALDELRPIEPALMRLGPEFVLAGPSPDVLVALLLSRCSLLNHTLHFPHLTLIGDQETHERDALDAWLMGLDLPSYERRATLKGFGFTDPSDPRWPLDQIRDERVRLFGSLLSGDQTLLKRYPVDGLLRRTTDGPPERGGAWERSAGDPRWTLWVRPSGRGKQLTELARDEFPSP